MHIRNYFKITSQQEYQAEGQALSDICLDMHSTHQSQVPANTHVHNDHNFEIKNNSNNNNKEK